MTSTNDTRTPAEIRYDAECNGTLYFAQPGELPEDEPIEPAELPLFALAADDKPEEIEALFEGRGAGESEPDPQPCGTLADGTPIMGSFDGTPQQGYHRAGCVEVCASGLFLIVDREGTVSGDGFSQAIEFDGATLAQFQALRDFLNSGALEAMHAAAVAWGRGA